MPRPADAPAAAAPVGEQVLAPAPTTLERGHEAVDVLVVQRHAPRHARLGGVAELHPAVAPGHGVLAAQGGQPERRVARRVLAGVLLVADAEDAEVEHPDRAGEHPVAAQPAAPRKAGGDLGAGVADHVAQARHAW
jgi:hypothetical protein